MQILFSMLSLLLLRFVSFLFALSKLSFMLYGHQCTPVQPQCNGAVYYRKEHTVLHCTTYCTLLQYSGLLYRYSHSVLYWQSQFKIYTTIQYSMQYNAVQFPVVQCTAATVHCTGTLIQCSTVYRCTVAVLEYIVYYNKKMSVKNNNQSYMSKKNASKRKLAKK